AVQAPGVEGEVARYGAGLEIDLYELPRELAGGDREPPVRREFHVVHTLARERDRLDQRHRLRVPEIELPAPLGHHDGEPAVRREVQIVRVRDRHTRAFATGLRIDGSEGVPTVVRDPQG